MSIGNLLMTRLILRKLDGREDLYLLSEEFQGDVNFIIFLEIFAGKQFLLSSSHFHDKKSHNLATITKITVFCC